MSILVQVQCLPTGFTSRIQGKFKTGRTPKNYRYRNPPYGLKVLNGCLVPDRRELRVVREIQELRRIGFGWMQIVEYLNAAGITSRQCTLWRRMGVKRICERWIGKA